MSKLRIGDEVIVHDLAYPIGTRGTILRNREHPDDPRRLVDLHLESGSYSIWMHEDRLEKVQ